MDEEFDHYEIDLDQIAEARRQAAARMVGHSWIQLGTSLHCTSCNPQHGHSIKPGMMLYGTDEDGAPILLPLDEFQRKRFDK